MRHHGRVVMLLTAAAVLVSGCSAAQGSKSSGQSTTNTTGGVPNGVVEVATDVRFEDGRTVSWVDARLEQTQIDDETVVSKGGPRRSAKFAPDGLLLTPVGCKEPYGEIKVDADGLGGTPCAWDDFVKQDLYAPKIWFGQDGRISKIAARYHP